jgi:hypothetical protein
MPTDKKLSHGRIGEAAVTAKCWMHGIRAYSTSGLRANFAGVDLLIESGKVPGHLVRVQVKTGYIKTPGHVYLTQCAGEKDLERDKFNADFVVFVGIDPKTASAHDHDGSLGFEHLSFYVVPTDVANELFRREVRRGKDRPLKAGGERKLGNMAVSIPATELASYRDAWAQLRA